ncbi:MAG: glutamyl-tRNA reductase [Chloroflexi bacterium]|nr:glutamyl-tRNA reductase [Chloroflexota bacterium]MCH8223496.1 glutamyl-tRNA reductase [Chloroflexota bacterium]
MHFLVAGVSHNSAPVERLQRLAINRKALPELLHQGALHLGDVVILSTCNRTEIYSVAENRDPGINRILEFLEIIDERLEPGTDPLSPYVYTLTDDDAIRHLFRVASGLDALVLGEPEIVGQVSQALRAAGEASSVSPRLSKLFHHALRTNRKVRRNTAIGQSRVSISSIGVDLLERGVGGLKGHTVLIVGAGETGVQAARALKRNGVSDILVASRRPESAANLASELGGTHLTLEEMPAAIAGVDAVVTCTASEYPIVSAADVKIAMDARPDRPLFMLDLAMPPDVESGVGQISGVTLYGLEALTGIANEHRSERQAAAELAEGIIDGEVEHFKELLIGTESEPLIRALGERAEAVRSEELARALRRIQSLQDDDREIIDAMTRAIVKKLLADPISYLRELEDMESASAVAKAFDLPEEPGDEAGGDREDGTA